MYDNVLAFFMKRRSIRSFKNNLVEEEKIEILLKAAMSAPSACNTQPWEIIVSREKETLDEIKDALPMARYNAPIAITVCANTHLCRHTKTNVGARL